MEACRLQALRDLELLDTPPEERFDRITRVVATVLGMPTAHITLIDADRQWWKSSFGVEPGGADIPRNLSFCSVAITGEDPLVVPDLSTDARFHDHPLVVDDPSLRFYAGAPLCARDGSAVGTLCVIDTEVRHLTAEQIDTLTQLARWAELELNLSRRAGRPEPDAATVRRVGFA